MTEIVSPFAQFFNTDGAPLNNGAIYIGTAYLDAQSNPLPVYWDDALTIPAIQPIRTLNGYAVRNGTPARIFCNADNFSMTVQTSTGRTVWSVQDATSESKTSATIFSDLAAPNGSSLIGFLQAGTGAVARTAQAKMRDIVSVKDFGAVGDGLNDDTIAIQTAVNSIASAGTIYFPEGEYKTTSQITLPQSRFITFEGSGSRNTRIVSYAGGVPMFNYARASSTSGSIFEFRNIVFQLNGLTKTPNSAAIQSFGFSDGQDDNFLRCYNCWFYGFQRAIYAKWTGQARISDCWFQANTTSITLLRGSSFWHLFKCMSFDDSFLFAFDPARDAYSNGLLIDSCNNITAPGTNVYVEGWQAVYMKSCGWDLGTAGTAAIWLKETYDVTIRDSYISSDATATRNGVFLDNAHSVVISACQIVNNVIGINVIGNATVATKLVIDACKFDGQDTNDVLFLSNVTASKIINNHFQKQMSRTGTNFEVYTNTGGTDYDIITQNTFKGTSYAIVAGANSVVTNNIFNVPGTV